MVPKGVSATGAGSPSPRDVSWFNRMYMKLETICVEVDKNPTLLLQETSKFVESQVNAVGTNVKKLCTELIQDLLSPEGGHKKAECALHCKCNCMDSEKRQLIEDGKGVSTKEESANDDATCKENIDRQKAVMNNEGDNVEIPNMLIERATMTEVLGVDAVGELQSLKSSDELCSKSSNTQEQRGIQDEPKGVVTSGQSKTEDVEGHEILQENVGIIKGIENCSVQVEEVEANSKTNDTRAHRMPVEGSITRVMEATLCRSEAVFAELASTPKTSNKWVATDINIGATIPLGSQKYGKQDDKCNEFPIEMEARDIECHCMLPASNGDPQQVLNTEMGPYFKVYDGNASCKDGLTFHTECSAAWELMDNNRGDRSLESVDNDDLKAGEPRMMSDFLTQEDAYDEEQSAHWFVHEDFRKAVQTELFSSENSRYEDGLVNELDSDWELL